MHEFPLENRTKILLNRKLRSKKFAPSATFNKLQCEA